MVIKSLLHRAIIYNMGFERWTLLVQIIAPSIGEGGKKERIVCSLTVKVCHVLIIVTG
jgi:hypothetical protein